MTSAPPPVNTDQWDKDSVVLIKSRLARWHRNTMLSRSKFDRMVTNKNVKLLDLGCGSGPFLAFFASQGFKNLYGVEPDAQLVANIPANIHAEVKTCRAEAIEFPDETFDVVFVYGVMHHLKGLASYEAACTEMARILKPGGLIFILEPGRPFVFRMLEISAKILGVFSQTFRALSNCMEAERPEQHFFLDNHSKIRQYLGAARCKPVSDGYFGYSWLYTVQKERP